MSGISFNDLANMADEADKPIPPGSYLFKITKGEKKQSKAGNTMIQLTAIVQSGPQAGKPVWLRLTASEKAARWFIRDVRALVGNTEVQLGADSDTCVRPFINTTFEADVTHDGTYNGQPNVNVNNIRNSSAAGATGADAPPPAAEAPSEAPAAEATADSPPPRPE